MLSNTTLSFDIVDTKNCKTLAILDSSYYNPLTTVSGALLQIKVPGYLKIVELTYNRSAITLLNSNNLNVTNVDDVQYLQDLPDGAYTIKISVCPYESNWYEQVEYRTCKIECKYNKAILYLDLNACSSCYSKELSEELATIRVYIEGVKANAYNNDIRKANELYNYANKELDKIINCFQNDPSGRCK
jgi:hypothetical protein